MSILLKVVSSEKCVICTNLYICYVNDQQNANKYALCNVHCVLCNYACIYCRLLPVRQITIEEKKMRKNLIDIF
jgi:hypothetical protein